MSIGPFGPFLPATALRLPVLAVKIMIMPVETPGPVTHGAQLLVVATAQLAIQVDRRGPTGMGPGPGSVTYHMMPVMAFRQHGPNKFVVAPSSRSCHQITSFCRPGGRGPSRGGHRRRNLWQTTN